MKLLEIIIAIILVYAIFSMIVSTLLEWWSSRRKLRGIFLNKALNRMLAEDSGNQFNPLMYDSKKRRVKTDDDKKGDCKYLSLLKRHPMISTAQNGGETRPAQYLDSEMFASALIDVISWEGKGEKETGENPIEEGVVPPEGNEPKDPGELLITKFDKGVESLDDDHSQLQKMLEQMSLKSGGEVEKLKKEIKLWYESQMDRVNGWYKRRLARRAFCYGFMVALLFNFDSIHMFRVISLDATMRTSLVAVADQMTDKLVADGPIDSLTLKEQFDILKSANKAVNNEKDIRTEESKKRGVEDRKSTYDQTTDIEFDKLSASLEAIKLHLEKRDSIGAVYVAQISQISNEVDKLGIPVGWSCSTFPLVLFDCNSLPDKLSGFFKKSEDQGQINKSDSLKNSKDKDKAIVVGSDSMNYAKASKDKAIKKDKADNVIQVAPSSDLGKYYAKRNAVSGNALDKIGSILVWLFGILISGIALSRGSNFWFEMMVKFVNIRRAGIKPEDKKSNKS
jgi:hypothetical protein